MMPTTHVRALAAAAWLPLAAGFAISARGEEAVRGAKELLGDYFASCLTGGDLACLDDYWVEDKAEGVRRGERVRRSMFPDLAYELHEVLVDGDRAAARFTVRGTHRDSGSDEPGPEGDEESGRLALEEAAFYTVRDGKILEGTLISDRLAVSEVLGFELVPRRPSGRDDP